MRNTNHASPRNAPRACGPRDSLWAFAKLPNEVVRDRRLSPAALVILAYAQTFINYTLSTTGIIRAGLVAGTGLGRGSIKRSRRELIAIGYLERTQAALAADGRFAYAKDRWAPLLAGGKDAMFVERRWFDGTLSLKAVAAWLYIKAGSGHGPHVYAAEVAVRFGWSRPTAAKVLAELLEKERIVVLQQRRQGRFASVAYRATAWPAQVSHRVKKPDHGEPSHGKPDHILRFPLHELPSGEEPLHNTASYEAVGSYGSPPSASAPGRPLFSVDELLSFEFPGELQRLAENHGFPDEFDDDDVTDLRNSISDGVLRARIEGAAQNRVAPSLLQSDGMDAFRVLAAAMANLHAYGDDPLTALNALDRIIEGIGDGIGAKPEKRLNSLKWLAVRVLGAFHDGRQRLFATNTLRPARGDAASAAKEIRAADINGAIDPQLFSGRGLRDLRSQMRLYGRDFAVGTIATYLQKYHIDGVEPGIITSWRYFDRHLQEELERCA